MPVIAKKSRPWVKKAAHRGHRPPAAKAKRLVAKKLGFSASAAAQFDVGQFCKRYSLKRDLVSRMTSYAPRTVADWATGKAVKGAALLKVTELKRLTNALERLVEPEFIGPWLQTPNEAFDGSTPAQLVERGESDRLWRMIHLLESGQAG